LRLGAVDDPAEREADRIADAVMAGGRAPAATPGDGAVRRTCAACDDEAQTVRRQPTAPAPAAGAAPPAVAAAVRGGGAPLPAGERAFFEPRLGLDLSGVRVHTGGAAAHSAAAIDALAYTVGSDVVFAAGRFAPSTPSGRRLLAHELAHVAQGDGGTIRRSITIADPTGAAVNQPGGAPAATKAQQVEGWIDTLCPAGNWTVDAASGVVSSPDRDTFCAPKRVPGRPHHTRSATPTSCRCICDLTAAAAPTIRLHNADSFTDAAGNVQDVNAAGEGVTAPIGAAPFSDFDVGISGKEHVGITGVGDTSPLAGAGRNQTLRDPPEIILGHEMCGHARLFNTESAQGHRVTPEGDREAVDIENRIRREHSTVRDSLGIRAGEIPTAGGTAFGGEFVAGAGETTATLARRINIAEADIPTHVFRNDAAGTALAVGDAIAAGERLRIARIGWHQVIKDETMTRIAVIWGVPLRALIRANPQIRNPDLIFPGQRLLVPVP